VRLKIKPRIDLDTRGATVRHSDLDKRDGVRVEAKWRCWAAPKWACCTFRRAPMRMFKIDARWMEVQDLAIDAFLKGRVKGYSLPRTGKVLSVGSPLV
jgi:hypothetical protein